MTEKIESMEVCPMRGHSRGEWYCSTDDIAPSEDKAEYWAVFGVTHRGNKHCLGEFATKTAAAEAARGFRFIRKGVQAPPKPGTKIVQIELVTDSNDSSMIDIFALCEDGSVWRRGIGVGRNAGLIDDKWEAVPLDDIGDRS